MSHTLKLWLATFIAFIAIVISMFFYVQSVHANPLYLSLSTGTSAASTSLNYMTPGTATTTETWVTTDSSNQALNSAVLLMTIRASTTPVNTNSFGTTTLSIRIEESMNGIDWATATTSTLSTNLIEQMGSVAVASTSATMRKITNIPTSLKYVRAVVGVQPGSPNNAAVSMQFVGQREIR